MEVFWKRRRSQEKRYKSDLIFQEIKIIYIKKNQVTVKEMNEVESAVGL